MDHGDTGGVESLAKAPKALQLARAMYAYRREYTKGHAHLSGEDSKTMRPRNLLPLGHGHECRPRAANLEGGRIGIGYELERILEIVRLPTHVHYRENLKDFLQRILVLSRR